MRNSIHKQDLQINCRPMPCLPYISCISPDSVPYRLDLILWNEELLLFVCLFVCIGLFSVNEVTGAITVAKQLDREANDTLKMRVLAEDDGKPKRTDHSEVEFVLTDVNDNAPIIRPRKSMASVFEVLLVIMVTTKYNTK